MDFLLFGDCHRAAFFGARLGNAFVGFRLIGLQFRADVASDIDVGDINGQNFKGRARIQTFFQYGARNVVGVFQDVGVTFG